MLGVTHREKRVERLRANKNCLTLKPGGLLNKLTLPSLVWNANGGRKKSESVAQRGGAASPTTQPHTRQMCWLKQTSLDRTGNEMLSKQEPHCSRERAV